MNVGPPIEPEKHPRCGHCGRFVAQDIGQFGDHLDGDCPVGGSFNVNGVLRGAKTGSRRRR